jgi:hypothetical protein
MERTHATTLDQARSRAGRRDPGRGEGCHPVSAIGGPVRHRAVNSCELDGRTFSAGIYTWSKPTPNDDWLTEAQTGATGTTPR